MRAITDGRTTTKMAGLRRPLRVVNLANLFTPITLEPRPSLVGNKKDDFQKQKDSHANKKTANEIIIKRDPTEIRSKIRRSVHKTNLSQIIHKMGQVI